MSRARRTKNRAGSLAGPENPPLIDKLVRYGASFPSVPGLVRSPVSLAPSSIRTVLRYTRATAVVGVAGATATQLFSGNGMFDPDITGVGGQPLGFDQWSALYQKYRVLASSIEVNLTSPDAASNDQAITYAVITPVSDAVAFTTLEAGASQPYAKSFVSNGISGTKMFLPMTSSMETSLMLGVSKATVLSDDQLNAATSSNPANQWYWSISLRAADSAATIAIQMLVTVNYLCDFWERNLPGLSVDLPKRISSKAIESVDSPTSSDKDKRARLLRELLALPDGD